MNDIGFSISNGAVAFGVVWVVDGQIWLGIVVAVLFGAATYWSLQKGKVR